MSEEKNNEVYEPREDSFLLEKAILKEKLEGKKCLDVGTGSGIQSRVMVKAGAEIVTAIDINKKALKKLKTQFVGHNFRAIESDLFNFTAKNPKEKFDFVAFNPPYVPSEKIKWKDTDGGEKGREIIDIFIKEVPKVLAEEGVLLLLVSSLNNEKEVTEKLKKKGFDVTIVAEEKFFFEKLVVLKARKN